MNCTHLRHSLFLSLLFFQDGEMVLLDGGCEYFGYVSDVTRTWPVSGKWVNRDSISQTEKKTVWRRSAWGVTEDQVPLIAAFSSKVLVVQLIFNFLLTIVQRISMRFRSGELDGQSGTVYTVSKQVRGSFKMINNSGPTPAGDTAHQIITDYGVTNLELDFQMKLKIYIHRKRGHWTSEQQSSSSSP